MKRFLIIFSFFVLILVNSIFAESKKGVLYVDSYNDILELGCGQMAFNYTLGNVSGIKEYDIERMHNKGIKITAIVTSSYRMNDDDLSSNPEGYQKPSFCMFDFTNKKLESDFASFLKKYGDYVDNYVIGNEISDQSWNYYKPSLVDEYVKFYCTNFKIAYDKIKEKNSNAKVFIPFDQSWDMPALADKTSVLSHYKYNTKEMLTLINKELDKSISWGVAAHPYPDPTGDCKFWDDHYAGHVDEPSAKEGQKAYVVTINNIEVMTKFLAQNDFCDKDGNPREVLISEYGLSNHQGVKLQAAAMAYTWKKIENNDQIIGLLYNAQVDTGDGYNFGLRVSGSNKRPIWSVFKQMDSKDTTLCDELIAQNIPSSYVESDAQYISKSSKKNNSVDVSSEGESNSNDSKDIKDMNTDDLINMVDKMDKEFEQKKVIKRENKSTADTSNSNNSNTDDSFSFLDYKTLYISGETAHKYDRNYNNSPVDKVIISYTLPNIEGEDAEEASIVSKMIHDEGKILVENYLNKFADDRRPRIGKVYTKGCKVAFLDDKNFKIAFEGADDRYRKFSFMLVYDREGKTLRLEE